ncbi:MAG: Calx-beta domain-containing protein, partial [Methylotenera sp.]|nr:Calx-beta domain-containing protein [Methylotenera sp.]
DTIDTTTVTLTASAASVVEGGSLVYTATVGAAVTGSPLVISLNNGQTITIPVGQVSASSAAFNVRADDVNLQGTQTVTVGITGTSGGNYEALNTASTVSSTVTDDADSTTVTLTATASVVEGGSIVYTASVNNPVAGSAVTVTLSGGQTITIPVGASTGTVSVAAPADDVYIDAGTVSKTITAVIGGNYEAVTINPAAASTTVTDTLNTTTVSITGSASVTEGNAGNYTVSLTAPTQTAMTVAISYSGTAANGSDYTGIASVVIPAGSSSASFNIATLDDANAEASENFTLTITGTSGGNFEQVAISGTNGAVTTQLVDNDTATVSLTATPTLTEAGGNLVYTATISQAPVSDLTVTLTGGTVITILAGQTSGTATVVVAPNEDVYIDAGTLSKTITGTTGGGITVNIDPTPAVTSITDTIDTTTVTLTASAASVVEGGSLVYTATVGAAVTGSPLVISLNNGQT